MNKERIEKHFTKLLEKPYGMILNLLMRDFDIDLDKLESKNRNIAYIVNLIKDEAQKDFSKVIKFYENNKQVLSLHPSDVEHILKISRQERVKWQENGCLKVLYYNTLYKYRKPVKVPYFDALSILNISDEDLFLWRNLKQKPLNI